MSQPATRAIVDDNDWGTEIFHCNVGTRTAPSRESTGTWASDPIAVELLSKPSLNHL